MVVYTLIIGENILLLLLLDTFLVHISSYLRYLAKVSSLAMSFNDFVEQYFTHNDGNQRGSREGRGLGN